VTEALVGAADSTAEVVQIVPIPLHELSVSGRQRVSRIRFEDCLVDSHRLAGTLAQLLVHFF
jgi:hypothetical protein